MAKFLTSKKGYFLKAWYEWIVDNELTPYIIVDARYPRVKVPRDYVQDGRITLNISPQAINNLKLSPIKDLKNLEFEADFDAPVNVTFISVPISAIVAIYANESGQGTLFPEEETINTSKSTQEKTRPEFTIVE